MVTKKPARKRKNPYPFKIPKIHRPPPELLNQLDPWAILEFFRVEALLRSKKIHQIYRDGWGPLIMEETYGFCFEEVLVEYPGHHTLIDSFPVFVPPLSPSYSPIRDITKELRKEVVLQDWFPLRKRIYSVYRHFRLDCRYPPETIIKHLRPLLKLAYQESLGLPENQDSSQDFVPPQQKDPSDDFVIPEHSFKKPPINNGNFFLWLDYLKCFDLRECNALSFGKIAQRVFDQSGNKAYRRAEQAHRRVTKLISDAEQNIWPPKIR